MKGESKKPQSPPNSSTFSNEKNVEYLENETLEAVNKAISQLEQAIAESDAKKNKSKEEIEKIKWIENYHSKLTLWTKEFLIGRGRSSPVQKRIEMILKLSEITKVYAGQM